MPDSPSRRKSKTTAGRTITRLPATGSRRILLHTRGAWISARNDHPRQIDETADRSCTEATLKKRPRTHPGRK
ncbi:hypothetical protein V6N12_010043 [Hibiscus sabdariffa]|uniref:Uncharacterized protein n=1 Tax=Hibiscus sabdariffa TaxID=183260 RepID=A0ABR2ECY9_9ROSI